MINTLLEHVPIKLESPENGDDAEDDDDGDDGKRKQQRHKSVKTNCKGNGNGNGNGNGKEAEEDLLETDDEEDDDSDEDDSETDLLEDDEDEETLVAISSDEEAQLEAQRIHFHELITKSFLNRSIVVKENHGSSVEQPRRGRSISSCASVSSKVSSISGVSSSTSDTTVGCQKVAKDDEQLEVSAQEQANKVNRVKRKTAEAPSRDEKDVKQRGRKRTSSICSVASSLVTPSCQTESCGNICVYEAQQKLILNCSFCDLRYGDMTDFSKHLHEAHNLFQLEDEVVPARKSARNQIKQQKMQIQLQTQAQTQELPLSVKVKSEQLPLNTKESDANVRPLSPLPADVTLDSCGNIFILNGKKLFLICGHCECKYATLPLFDKHMRQQHEFFSGPVQEIDVLPKQEVKVEVCMDEQSAVVAIESNPQKKVNVEPTVESPTQPMVVLPMDKNVGSNDLLLAPVVVQTPETPPPEEEKIEKEEEKLETAVLEPNTINQSNSNGEEHAQLVQEQQVDAVCEPAVDSSKVKDKDEKLPRQRPNKRKRKRRSLYTRRPPAKRRVTTSKATKLTEATEATEVSNADEIADTSKSADTTESLKSPIVEDLDLASSAVVDVSAVAAPTSNRNRRKSNTQKSYKDFFPDESHQQQPPSSPESADWIKSFKNICPLKVMGSEIDGSKDVLCVMPLAANSGKMKNRFPCNQCSKSFVKASRLAEHQRLHTGEKPFRCDECGKAFRIKMRLTEHQMRHRKVKAYKCETCGLAMATKQDLSLHKRHHSNDRRHHCTECPKAFVRSTDLRIHLRVHTGEKPFVCEICQKTFRANQNLIVHRRSHLGEKNYKCDYCDKRFMRNIDRKVHHRTHTGEKPFKCEICDRGYSSRAHVRSHIEREHMGKVESKRERKKPGPKPKRLKEELAKQKQIIEELQQQLLQCIKTDNVEQQEQIEQKVEKESSTQKSQMRPNSRQRSSPALQKVEDIDTLPESPVSAMGVQKVSVTVSMQVQEEISAAETDEPMPEKENDTTMMTGVSSLKKGTKNERKITSYFTVVGQKTEI